MKTYIIGLCFLFVCLISAHAEYRNWTSADGRTVEMELISVNNSKGNIYGEFRLRNGKTVVLGAKKLAEDDAKILAEWKITTTHEVTYVGYKIPQANVDPNLPFPITGTHYVFSITGPRIVSATLLSVKKFESSTTKPPGKRAWELRWTKNHEARPASIEILMEGLASTRKEVEESTFEAVLELESFRSIKDISFELNPTAIGKGNSVKAGPFKFWLGENIQDPLDVPLMSRDPFSNTTNPIQVEGRQNIITSLEVLIDGTKIKRLSEAKGRTLTVKIKYQDDFSKTTVVCTKRSSVAGTDESEN